MRNLKILVLEDHPFQRAMVVAALRNAGIDHILEASDGSQAIAKLKEVGGVDIAVCDLSVPGMDGAAALRHAFQSSLITAVIISSDADISVRVAVSNMVKHLGLQYLGDLEKPLRSDALLSILDNFEGAGQTNSLPETMEVFEVPCIEDVKRGLGEGEFKAFYQPKFNVNTRQVQGAEVLVRWLHPQLGTLSPAQFLPIVESCGLIDSLFWGLIEQGLKLQENLSGRNKSIQLAFNLQASQLSSRTLVEELAEMLRYYQLPASGLMLEVTEAGMLTAPATSMENLVRLRLMGCGLAMDDFGAGYSSLARLCELPFNQIKLDATFIQKYNSAPRSKAIIQAAVALAGALSIELVVEGVETREQSLLLSSIGSFSAQGFYYAMPMSLEEFQYFLDESYEEPFEVL